MSVTTAPESEPFYWDQFRDTTVGRYLFGREYAFISRVLGRGTCARTVLDLGCGSGRLTVPLRNAGHHVVGVDLSLVALRAFRRRSRGIPLVQGDTSNLPFADGSFDGVVAIQTLEFVEVSAFMRQCGRVLRPGGLLIFDALNRRSYKWHLKNRVGRRLELPSADLDYRDVLRAVIHHELEILAVSGYNWLPFTRHSNSRLVRAAALVESTLRLDRYYRISPKILVAARRRHS